MDNDDTLAQFESYLRRRFPDRRTAIDYLSDIRQFRAVCSKPWREIDMHDIDAFVDQQRAHKLKQATVARRVAALKTFFDFLAEESDDPSWRNPVHYKRHAGKRGRQLPRDLHDDDLDRLWQVLPSARDRAWFALMVRAGLRVGEVTKLKLDDLVRPARPDQPAQIRVCGKGCKERIVLLTADAYAVLEAWLSQRPAAACPNVFLNDRQQPLSANGIEWLLRGYGQLVGLHVTPHQLRHTYARQLTEAGMPVTSLGKLMGHEQITTTQIYTAGADPALAQAYQTAMNQLSQLTLLPPSSPPPAAPPAESRPEPTVPQAPPASTRLPAPELPDGQTWATHLPAAIRQASLDYVKRRALATPAPQRRQRAQTLMSELVHLWDWFLAQRPITQPGELNLKDLRAYQTDQLAREYAAGTINRRLDYILGILRELADQDVPVDHSVFRLRALPRADCLPRHLTDDESRRFEAVLRERQDSPQPLVRLETACAYVLLHSGLRKSECVNLRVQDLDLPGQRLVVRQGKGQRDRVVYLSPDACQALHRYLDLAPQRPTDALWLYPDGKPMSEHWLRDHVAALGQAASIDPLYPHRLRHTCATRLVNAGMDIVSLQKLLGHEQITTTMIYARISDRTVEADFRTAMSQIERRAGPMSNQPVLIVDWPTQIVKEPIDNSV